MTPSIILVIVAVVLFDVAAVRDKSILAAGLFCWALAELV